MRLDYTTSFINQNTAVKLRQPIVLKLVDGYYSLPACSFRNKNAGQTSSLETLTALLFKNPFLRTSHETHGQFSFKSFWTPSIQMYLIGTCPPSNSLVFLSLDSDGVASSVE